MGYDNGKIYAIRSHQTDKMYIGSTTNTLSRRLSYHKTHYKRWKNGERVSYVSSYELMKYDDAYIEVIENYPCSSREELNKREGHYIREMDCVNMSVAGRDKNEYMREYWTNNKDKIKSYSREWRENNKEYIKSKTAEYLKKNAEKIKQKKSKLTLCECGGKYQNSVKARHLRTKKHISFKQIDNL